RCLGAGDCERMPEIHGYANSYMPKRIETSARKLSMQVPQTAGHDGVRFLDLPNALRFFRGREGRRFQRPVPRRPGKGGYGRKNE
ncbi:MAG: hypothetical protein WA957_06960, partial [Alteraurantiacibacter sp.]